MAETTYTPNLKLRLDSKLTANSRFNLQKLDALGGTFVLDSTGVLRIRSALDILIEPESAAVGGSGAGGTVDIGTDSHSLEAVNVYADDVEASARLTGASIGARAGDFRAALAAPGSLAEDLEWTLPDSLGESGQVPQLTDDAGTLGWATIETSFLPARSIRVGNSDAEATSVNTSALGDILADPTTGLTVKSGLAYAKLDLADSIVDGDIAAAAAIALSKLAATTADRALISDTNGAISVSSVTAAELARLSGVTSAVQTQLDGKLDLAGGTMSGALVLSGDAASALQPVTKQQFDAAIFGLDGKPSVAVATSANVTLSGEQTLDLVLTSSSRVLVRAQTDPAENGLYVSAAGAWSRAEDADEWDELPGALVSVESGTVYGGSLWMCVAVASGTLGTDDIDWTQVSGPGTYTTDGQGLALTGTQFSVELDGGTLTKSASGLKVTDAGIANAQIAAGAAIAYSKLALADSLLVSDLASSAVSGTGTAVLTDTGASASGLTVSDHLTFTEQASAPSTPAAGKKALYARTDGKVYTLDSVGIEQEVGSGAGGGGAPNAISNPFGASDVDGYTASGTATVTRVATGGPLDPVVDTAVRLDGGSTGDYVAHQFQMPEGFKQRVLPIRWTQAPETGAASGEWKVELWTNDQSDYSGTYTEVPLYTDSSGDSTIAAFTGSFQTEFTAADQDYYEIRWVRVTGANHLDVTGVSVDTGSIARGAVVGEWQDYTPTVSGLAATVTGAKWRQVGTNMELDGYITASGAASDTITVSLPSGYTLDRTAMADANGFHEFGVASAKDNSTAADRWFARVQDVSSTELGFIGETGTWNATVPFTWATADIIRFQASVPIAEWAGSGTTNLGASDVEYAYTTDSWDATSASDGSDTSYGMDGAEITGALTANRVKYVVFRSSHQPGDHYKLQIKTGGIWLDADGYAPFVTLNTASYGARPLGPTSGNVVRVQFGQYYNTSGAATYGAAGTDWSSSAQQAWRVVKHRAGIPVGFGLATSEFPGLVKKNKWQKKALTSDVTVDTTGISDLELTNLEVGKTYRLTISAKQQISGTSTTEYGRVRAKHNSSVLIALTLRIDGSTDTRELDASKTVVFTATATSITFDWDNGASGTSTLISSAADGGTFVVLEELANYEETDEW